MALCCVRQQIPSEAESDGLPTGLLAKKPGAVSQSNIDCSIKPQEELPSS